MNTDVENMHPREARTFHAGLGVGFLLAWVVLTQKVAHWVLNEAVKHLDAARDANRRLKTGEPVAFHVTPDGQVTPFARGRDRINEALDEMLAEAEPVPLSEDDLGGAESEPDEDEGDGEKQPDEIVEPPAEPPVILDEGSAA